MRGEPDDDKQQTPEELGADGSGEAEAPDLAEGDEPGAADFLKAAAKGAKNLRKLEP